MFSTAIVLALSFASFMPSHEVAAERAAKVADTYQPRAPKVRMVERVRCVTTLDATGAIESHRCDL